METRIINLHDYHTPFTTDDASHIQWILKDLLCSASDIREINHQNTHLFTGNEREPPRVKDTVNLTYTTLANPQMTCVYTRYRTYNPADERATNEERFAQLMIQCEDRVSLDGFVTKFEKEIRKTLS